MSRLITVSSILALIAAITIFANIYTNDTSKMINDCVDKSITACEKEDKEALMTQINAMSQLLEKRHSVLSLYVRHDEIEKLETHHTTLEAYAELDAFDSAKVCLFQIKFISNHIYQREALSIDNIF